MSNDPIFIKGFAVLLLSCLVLPSCVHQLTMHARDGERLNGRWRLAREGTALIQVIDSNGEVLAGTLTRVARRNFFESYQQTFGPGSIDAEGPELSSYGNALLAAPGTRNALTDVVYGESFDKTSGAGGHSVTGPLVYWTAHLHGDSRAVMQCFLIASSHSTRGLGRCKGASGKEYTVSF
jgi:hypothetical protein